MVLRAVIAVAVALATPAGATASTVAVRDHVLVYSAAPGEENLVGLNHDERFWLIDYGAAVGTSEGCRQIEEKPGEYHYYRQQCDAAGVTSVRIELGDQRDVGGTSTDLPVTLLGGDGDDHWLEVPLHGVVDGGPGADTFQYFRPGDSSMVGGLGSDRVDFDPGSGGSFPQSGVRVSLDGVADDGPEPDPANNVLPDVEDVSGSAGPDTIVGSDGDNTLDGGLGTDTVSGADGDDSIDAVDVYHDIDNHHPPLDYRPTRDEVTCGTGTDVVKADRLDVVSNDCERVSVFKTRVVRVDEYHWTYERQLRLALFTLRGSDEPDRLIGVDHAPNRILAGAGDDRIRGGSRADEIDAGPGADVVRPGRRDDAVTAGSGDDVISARDRDVDTIACGGGRDRVVADRGDRVSRGCEVVHRR
jgi:Ca2+-binding RTX toxin-like protein